jgi:hypothetical protein
LACKNDWRQAQAEWNNLSHVTRKVIARFWPALDKALVLARNSSSAQFPHTVFQGLSIACDRIAENLQAGTLVDD